MAQYVMATGIEGIDGCPDDVCIDRGVVGRRRPYRDKHAHAGWRMRVSELGRVRTRNRPH